MKRQRQSSGTCRMKCSLPNRLTRFGSLGTSFLMWRTSETDLISTPAMVQASARVSAFLMRSM